MAGRTPWEAVQNFVDPLQRALDCVTDAVVDVKGGYYPAATPHVLTINQGNTTRLSGDERLALAVVHGYRVIENPDSQLPWQVVTASYLYTLSDVDGPEILAYHWHPEGRSPITFPHFHLLAGAEVRRGMVADAHLPTQRMGLESVLRLAIRDFGVRPRRTDWSDVLDRAQFESES